MGKALEISLGIAAPAPRRVTLHCRRVNQAERWQSLEMNRDREVFRGEIPAAYTDYRFALQYYFEIQTGPAAVTLFPALAADLANVPYCVVPCTSFSGFPYQAGLAVNRFRGVAVQRTSPPRVPS